MRKSSVKLFLSAAFALVFFATSAVAQGPHPAYLHALSDVRAARRLLDGLNNNPREHEFITLAIAEIDRTIVEIKQAAIDDGKNLNDAPPPEVGWGRGDRLSRAVSLLDKAYKDIDQHESDDYSRGLKHRALDHLQQARIAARHAWENVN
jgi:hypothetical protein